MFVLEAAEVAPRDAGGCGEERRGTKVLWVRHGWEVEKQTSESGSANIGRNADLLSLGLPW